MALVIKSDGGDLFLEDIQSRLEGTCMSLAEVISSGGLHISEDELQDILLDGQNPVEICGGCGWWHQSGVLEFLEEKNSPYCADCLRDEGIED